MFAGLRSALDITLVCTWGTNQVMVRFPCTLRAVRTLDTRHIYLHLVLGMFTLSYVTGSCRCHFPVPGTDLGLMLTDKPWPKSFKSQTENKQNPFDSVNTMKIRTMTKEKTQWGSMNLNIHFLFKTHMDPITQKNLQLQERGIWAVLHGEHK